MSRPYRVVVVVAFDDRQINPLFGFVPIKHCEFDSYLLFVPRILEEFACLITYDYGVTMFISWQVE
jgi:hypothetical protein